jgi:UDP-N-acetylglucosamine--N-acetylmuramyl-(pentapeptide) pyrophosphoryl-undecaprenol N-acetylglucosamine transferase
VREDICQLSPPQKRYQQRQGALRILVLGGSQGAVALNEKLPAALKAVSEQVALCIRHQAGEKNLPAAQHSYQTAGLEAQVVAFIDDMAEAYGWADLVICRSGALTVSELAAAGVASVLVPFPFAVDDHQTKNAKFLVTQGAAELLPQAEISSQLLAAKLVPLLANRSRLLAMAEAARDLAMPQATKQLIDLCLKEIQHG